MAITSILFLVYANLTQISKENRKLWWRKKNIFTVSLLTKEASFTGDGDVGRGGSYIVTRQLEKDKDPRKLATSHELIMDKKYLRICSQHIS